MRLQWRPPETLLNLMTPMLSQEGIFLRITVAALPQGSDVEVQTSVNRYTTETRGERSKVWREQSALSIFKMLQAYCSL